MKHAYRELLDIKIATREAARLVGLSRTTIYRKPPSPVDQTPVVPPNKLSPGRTSRGPLGVEFPGVRRPCAPAGLYETPR